VTHGLVILCFYWWWNSLMNVLAKFCFEIFRCLFTWLGIFKRGTSMRNWLRHYCFLTGKSSYLRWYKFE
jgi:hypothetical protein